MGDQEAFGEIPGAGAKRDPVGVLEARLGVPLADRGTALAALTHKSYVNEHREGGLEDNERLEFLGDAVIDLAVSHRLMQRFPEAREGELSKMRAAVVDERGLCEMARALDLGALLRLGRGEELTGGREKASLLADAMEAIVAAVFLGAGLPPVLRIVDRFLGEAFLRASAGTLDRDFKTQLQELAQSRLRATPRYRVVAERGPDHAKTFEVETDLRGDVLGRGAGRSKKDAEQAAAKLALDHLARRFGDGDGQPPGGPGQCGSSAPAAEGPTLERMAPALPPTAGAEPVAGGEAANPPEEGAAPAPGAPPAIAEMADGAPAPDASAAGEPKRPRSKRARKGAPVKTTRTARAKKTPARPARKGARTKR